jgi:hypothetical protein
MKKMLFLFLYLLFICVAIFFSCKKEKSCEGCKENRGLPENLRSVRKIDKTLADENIEPCKHQIEWDASD